MATTGVIAYISLSGGVSVEKTQPQHLHAWSLRLSLVQGPGTLREPSDPDPPSNELPKSAGHETDTAHSLDTTRLLLGLLPSNLLGPVHLPSRVTAETWDKQTLVWSWGSRKESGQP